MVLAMMVSLALRAGKAGSRNRPFQLQEAIRTWFGGQGLQQSRGNAPNGSGLDSMGLTEQDDADQTTSVCRRIATGSACNPHLHSCKQPQATRQGDNHSHVFHVLQTFNAQVSLIYEYMLLIAGERREVVCVIGGTFAGEHYHILSNKTWTCTHSKAGKMQLKLVRANWGASQRRIHNSAACFCRWPLLSIHIKQTPHRDAPSSDCTHRKHFLKAPSKHPSLPLLKKSHYNQSLPQPDILCFMSETNPVHNGNSPAVQPLYGP